jgi:ABC-type phosphate/phosphonate transport system substrate-binding protein
MSAASLPMYDLPELRDATDGWWRGLARAFAEAGIADVPAVLSRDHDYGAVWRDPGLLFSQTCGYPLMHELRGRVRLVATPCYSAPGCAGADYCSFVVVRRDSGFTDMASLWGARCAVNGLDSQSGYSALRVLAAPYARAGKFFGEVAVTGGHRKSIEMVAAGKADAAAVDCVTFGLLARHRPAAIADIRVLCQSPSAPNLPFITGLSADDGQVARMRAGLRQAFADPELADARDALMLSGCEFLPLESYDRILEIENQAIALGYGELA